MLSFHTWRLCAVVSLWAWGATGESTYLGCFKDASVLRDFNPETQVRTVTLSPSFCETHCKLVGGGPYRYFALQNGDLCYCSQTYGRYGASDLCTTKCVGGSTPPASQGMCGGHDANAVYSIVGVDRLINAIPGGEAVQHNNTSGNSQQQHQQQQQQQAKPESKIEVKKFGCFRDKSPGRAFSGEPMEDERMTPSKCARHCVDQAARYMALQDGNQCFCGNSPGDKLGKSTKCTKACAGDGATTCGGPFANQVYELSVVTATPAPGSPEALPAGASSAGLFAVATINCGVPGAVLVAGAAVFLTSYGSRAHCTTVALANTNTYAKAAASVFVGAVLAQVAAVYVAALLGHILPDSRMFSPYVTKLLSAAACVTCGLTQVSRSFDVASRDQDELRDELFAAMADHGDTKVCCVGHFHFPLPARRRQTNKQTNKHKQTNNQTNTDRVT